MTISVLSGEGASSYLLKYKIVGVQQILEIKSKKALKRALKEITESTSVEDVKVYECKEMYVPILNK